ncbi:MFS transporter [Saccharothrix syringae]|uniref:MFS transporter n=1 Tax=Saccharothrix syringae TaxID=103733 RepID=UPI001D17A8BB|nr:MFS transporter [Saccharothrix syringae]
MPTPANARRFMAATVIDALGSGLWMPFTLLFLVHGQGMGLVEAGGALSTGALLGLAAGPLSGSPVDRFGPVAVLVAGNLVRLVAFACYPSTSSAWQVALVATAISAGDRLFWTANAPVAAALTTGRGTEDLLGTQAIARFLGAGLGAGATALVPDLGDPSTYHLLAHLNAGSFGVAALLVAGVRVPRVRPAARHGGWTTVLRDRPYTAFCAVHVLFTLASASKYAMLPILVLDVLEGPHWVPGAALGIGTAVVVLVQKPVTRLAARWSRGTGLVVAATAFACSFAALVPVAALPVGAAVAVVLAVSVTFAFAEALFAPLSTAAAAAAAPPGAEGRASALFQLSWAVPAVTGPALLTALLSLGNPVLWAALTLTSAAAVPATLRLRRVVG